MKNYTLYKISLWSLLKIGFLVGWIVAFLPVALVAFVFFKLVSTLAGWLSGLVYQISLPLPGNFGFDINLIELLKLQGLMERLHTWQSFGLFQTLLLVLLVTSLIALFCGIVAATAGLVFNLLSKATGGVKLAVAEDSLPGEGLAPKTGSSNTV